MRILLTGFEPFDGSSTNPSQEVARRLAEYPPQGIELHTAILPVDHQLAPQILLQAIDAAKPEAVVCLGEASHRAMLSLERVAVNLVDDRIPDNSGEAWQDRPVVVGGPAAYFVTLPVKTMQRAILEAGVPVELSLSAGSYLCNQVAYTLLHYLASQDGAEDIPAGFIHLPRLPVQAAEKKIAKPESGPIPSMGLEDQVRGVEAGLRVLLK
jgi:pyroglutamyl-peptidase